MYILDGDLCDKLDKIQISIEDEMNKVKTLVTEPKPREENSLEHPLR